ncbi:unnamed protein product [Amoebophrya sp. A25]|nr:unnamed protein product [Amoebophrya sp. A25]|eukprot:GSA25T00014646001.1
MQPPEEEDAASVPLAGGAPLFRHGLPSSSTPLNSNALEHRIMNLEVQLKQVLGVRTVPLEREVTKLRARVFDLEQLGKEEGNARLEAIEAAKVAFSTQLQQLQSEAVKFMQEKEKVSNSFIAVQQHLAEGQQRVDTLSNQLFGEQTTMRQGIDLMRSQLEQMQAETMRRLAVMQEEQRQSRARMQMQIEGINVHVLDHERNYQNQSQEVQVMQKLEAIEARQHHDREDIRNILLAERRARQIEIKDVAAQIVAKRLASLKEELLISSKGQQGLQKGKIGDAAASAEGANHEGCNVRGAMLHEGCCSNAARTAEGAKMSGCKNVSPFSGAARNDAVTTGKVEDLLHLPKSGDRNGTPPTSRPEQHMQRQQDHEEHTHQRNNEKDEQERLVEDVDPFAFARDTTSCFSTRTCGREDFSSSVGSSPPLKLLSVPVDHTLNYFAEAVDDDTPVQDGEDEQENQPFGRGVERGCASAGVVEDDSNTSDPEESRLEGQASASGEREAKRRGEDEVLKHVLSTSKPRAVAQTHHQHHTSASTSSTTPSSSGRPNRNHIQQHQQGQMNLPVFAEPHAIYPQQILRYGNTVVRAPGGT